MARTPKPKNWTVLTKGTPLNPAGFYRVADRAEALRWWKSARFYSFESYATLAEAEARVAELVATNARKLDVARTLTWVNNGTSWEAEFNYHRGLPTYSKVNVTPPSHADLNRAIATRMSA